MNGSADEPVSRRVTTVLARKDRVSFGFLPGVLASTEYLAMLVVLRFAVSTLLHL